jgi:hypothetical protein
MNCFAVKPSYPGQPSVYITAHAASFQDFSFSLDGGPAVTFTLDPTAPSIVLFGVGVAYNPVTFSDGTTGNFVEFTEPSVEALESMGPADFGIINAANFEENFVGPQLYTGSESDPIFNPGTYNLIGDDFTKTPATETLTLTIGSPPAVPEPSSMVLFGTGVLGCAGAVRRRFLKA